jgi:hypothetical protein
MAVTGCGGSARSSSTSASSAAAADAATVRSADCKLWRLLSPSERQRLLVGMRQFFGGPVDPSHGRGPVLGDRRANALFDSYCSQPFARAFKLYKIYGRAAAFTPQPQ